MSDNFRNAREISIGENSNFSTVNGDQYNNTTIVTTTRDQRKLWIQGTEEEEADFEQVRVYGGFSYGLVGLMRDVSQYNEVKRGDVELIRATCSFTPDPVWQGSKYRHFECEKKVFIGQALNGIGQGSMVTVVGYEGRDAREVRASGGKPSQWRLKT